MTVAVLCLALALPGAGPVAAVPVPVQEAPADVPPPPPPVFDLEPLRPPVEPSDAPLAADTLRPVPPPAVLDAYRADPDFQYDRPQAEGPSLWDRFWDWVARTLWRPVAETTSSTVWEWLLIGLAVAGLGWALARVLQAGGVGVFTRGGRASAAAGPLLDVEAIAEVDLEARLRFALDAGDHREAVRVRYLRLLQALDAAGLLAWRRDKTNRQYVAEVAAADPARARPFRRATRAFDAVWYGERPVSEALYARLAPVFDGAQPSAP